MKTMLIGGTIACALTACAGHHQTDTGTSKSVDGNTHDVAWYLDRPHARRLMLSECYHTGFKLENCTNAKSAAVGAGDEAYITGEATPSAEDAMYDDDWYAKHPLERHKMLDACRQKDPSFKTDECHYAALGAKNSGEKVR